MSILKIVSVIASIGFVVFFIGDYFHKSSKIKELNLANNKLEVSIKKMQDDKNEYEKYIAKRFELIHNQQVIFIKQQKADDVKIGKIKKVKTSNSCDDFKAFFDDLEKAVR